VGVRPSCSKRQSAFGDRNSLTAELSALTLQHRRCRRRWRRPDDRHTDRRDVLRRVVRLGPWHHVRCHGRRGAHRAGQSDPVPVGGPPRVRRAGTVDSGHQNRHDPRVKIPGVASVRLTVRSLIYVVAVAVIAALGFTEQSPWPILLAALLAVPSSIVAVPCYYLAYGFLALIPGANPSSSSGTPAAWFTVTTFVLGILALTVAAFANVLLLRALAARRSARRR